MDQKPKSFLAKWLFRKEQPIQQPEDEQNEAETLGTALPHSMLDFTPEQQQKIPVDDQEKYKQYLAMMPPLKVGEVNFICFETGLLEDGYYARVFIRFARSLEEEFTLDRIPLTLYDHAKEPVAKGLFEPKGFGTLRFGETRLWTFVWKASQVIKKDADFTSFTIRIE